MLRRAVGLLARVATIFVGIFIAFSNNAFPQESSPIPGVVLSEPISNVTDSLSYGIVAVADTHRVGFNTTATPLSDSAIIWVSYPDGFDITSVTSVIYSDDDPSNDGDEPTVSSWEDFGQTLKCYFHSGDDPAEAGFRISLKIAHLVNNTQAGNYSVIVFASDSLENIGHGPAGSTPFTLAPAGLDHVIITPGSDTSIAAGSSIAFNAGGYDQYGNLISGLSFIYAVTVDSCGDILDGVFTADKLGSCYVTASSGGVTDSSGLITVFPGPFDRFTIGGTPTTRTAGISFTNPVVVEVYDIRDNIKTDYSGTIWFQSNDSSATLPFESGNPFNFPIDSAGVARFAGSGFILYTAGSRTISVTNGSDTTNSSSIMVAADRIAAFELSAGLNQTAGQSFLLNVPYPTAVDQYGNPASGTIIISDSIGGGNSPGGIPPVLNPIVVNNGNGSNYQMLTNAVPTILKGTSESGVVIGSDSIFVAPGSFNGFTMAGYPSSLTAGDTFPGGVTVIARDAYGNPKINYTDSVYFSSSDILALLPPGHRFTLSDSGSYTFGGTQFSLRTAGPQTITVLNSDNSISETSTPINVGAAGLADFSFTSPSFATCGIPFVLVVINGVDQWGNSAGGVVIIDSFSGGGSSPNGTEPVLNSIQVTDGSGSANQTLVNAIPTVLRGTSDSTVILTNSIDVRPGNTGAFDLVVSSPQYNDSAFTGTANLTAFDEYGNTKTDYDASVDTVVITSSAGGSMSNNVLRLAGDFSNGVADLVARQTTYSGRGGLMTFSATSESGVVGISGPVEMRAITCDNVVIDQGIASWGDTVTGSVDVSNDGGVIVNINEIDIFTSDSILFNPYSVSPSLPAQIGAGQQQIFDISFVVPGGTTTGVHPISGAVFGDFGGTPVSDTLDTYPDTLEIQSYSEIGYVAGSLSRDTLSTASWYTLTLLLSNTGGAGLALYDSSNFSFTNGIVTFRADISSGVYLPPDSPLGTLILLDSAYVDTGFISQDYQPVFNYYGRENGDFVSGSFDLSDMVTIQQGIEIYYYSGSISIDSLVQGQNAVFTLRLRNDGDAPFVIDHANSKLTFSDSVREFLAYSDTSSMVRVDILPPHIDTVFHFTPTVLVPEFETGSYIPIVTLRGTQNGDPELRQFNTSPDSVVVLTRGSLQIDSTYTMSRNAPFINVAQPCSVKVAVSNQGLEPVSSFYIRLRGDNILDSTFIANIGGAANAAVIFDIAPISSPDSGLILTSTFSGGTGTVSGQPPLIMQPLDNTALLIVETPANLSLSPLTVTSPPRAMDDTVTTGQQITLSASVTNLGTAEIEGGQRLTLDLGSSGFSLTDSAARDYNLDEPVYWDVTAPASPNDSSVLTVRFLERPIDVNDGSDAVGQDSVSSRTFVVNANPIIDRYHAVISAPGGALDGILSTGQLFEVSDTVITLGIFENLTALLELPDGFSTQDPLNQTPVGGLVSWMVRAPDGPLTDSIGVSTWLFDPNTGDSTGVDTSLEVTIVEKATLNLVTSIAGPLEALDGILEPGSSFQYEVVVRNLGDAATDQGVVSLHLGDSSLTVVEDTIQSFNPDIPVVWNITVPDSETTIPIPIWTQIDFVPFDENTDAPATVINDSSSINITIKQLLPELVINLDDIYRGSVYKGQALDFMTFTLRNRDRGGSFPVSLDSIMFTVLLNPQGSIDNAFSTIALVSDSVFYDPISVANDSIFFTFDTMTMEPGEARQFALRIQVSQDASADYFQFFLNSGDISGSILEQGTPTIPLAAVSTRGEEESFSSRPALILEQDFSSSVSSYPNPFNPRAEQARIGYYLAEDSDLEVRIFTLLGELVWSKMVSASDPEGSAGLHSESTNPILWDGKNDKGSEVRSGVYICLFKNATSGEEEKLKIAVVK